MNKEFDKLKYEFILKVLSIFEKHGGLVLPGKNYPDQRRIAKLTDELGNTFNNLLAEVEQPLLEYFLQKKRKASADHALLRVPRCFGLEHSDDTKCKICDFEFDCERTIFN